MVRPQIDVLLATCRPDAELLRAQLESIRAQRDVEVSVLRREDPAGEGPAANFSALLAGSSADYVAFADQDDVWRPEKLKKLAAKLLELEGMFGRGTPLLVFSDSLVVDRDLRPLPGTFLSRQRVDVLRGVRLPRLLMQNFIAGNTMLFNAALRRKAGAVPAAALMHDSWIALVAAAFGRIGFVDEPLVLYRQHGGNAVGAVAGTLGHAAGRAAEGRRPFRERLARNVAQAAAFVERFGEESPDCARALAHLNDLPFFARRLAIVRQGLFKQGVLRNLALLAFV